MVHELFTQPTTALWVYIFSVIILLILSYLAASAMRKYDKEGHMRARGGLAALLIAIILGIVIFFLISSGQNDWGWFLALLPVAILLFGIYFAVFFALGRVLYLLATIVALFLMIWLVYYAIVTPNQWPLLAFPIIFLILLIIGGVGMGMYGRMKKEQTSDILSEVGLSSEKSE
jgi:hypothetical protein